MTPIRLALRAFDRQAEAWIFPGPRQAENFTGKGLAGTVLEEQKRKRERFIIRNYAGGGHGMSFLRCEYLVDLPGVVEAYMNEWRDRQREESIRELPDTLSDWGFSPEEIAKLRPGVENLINEYIGPEVKLCPDFKARMVDYI